MESRSRFAQVYRRAPECRRCSSVKIMTAGRLCLEGLDRAAPLLSLHPAPPKIAPSPPRLLAGPLSRPTRLMCRAGYGDQQSPPSSSFEAMSISNRNGAEALPDSASRRQRALGHGTLAWFSALPQNQRLRAVIETSTAAIVRAARTGRTVPVLRWKPYRRMIDTIRAVFGTASVVGFRLRLAPGRFWLRMS